ncbi:hypothetical protein AB1Y20_007243 [Prymnesium parvum]|uniref:Calmodulin-lysine N-methyltransferase n=1 Tax=Prymnesium parvum TaxID=97485 RepID=A0AB34IWL0_PRYPA
MSASLLAACDARAADGLAALQLGATTTEASVTLDDCMELLECARYGEAEELEQLLRAGVPVDFQDDSGNTALHKAGANGHVSCIEVLAAAGARLLPNASGNLPLHWAVQQGHLGAVQAFLRLFADADVLAQNEFGRSISTEAFALGKPEMVEVVLQHTSAKKLEPEGQLEFGVSADVTHRMAFRSGLPTVELRELAEIGADDPTQVLGATAEEDRTGLQLWAASLVLSHWLVEMKEQLIGRSVCELGAGCGLCGIVAAKLCGAARVLLTDLAPKAMDNLAHNIHLNALSPPNATAAVLDWREATTWPSAHDVVIGADLVYADQAVSPLLRVVQHLVAPNGCFLYVCPETNRQGEVEFLKGLCTNGFDCQVSAVPNTFLRNVLQDRSDEEFSLLFGELKERTYSLYCFSRSCPASKGPP